MNDPILMTNAELDADNSSERVRYIHLNNDPIQFIRIDLPDNVLCVLNVPCNTANLDALIAKLQALREEITPPAPVETMSAGVSLLPENEIIHVKDVQPKAYKRNGEIIQPKNSDGIFNASLLQGGFIRIYGTFTNRRNGPIEFDKTFRVGDQCEYDSYNFKYVGTIVHVGKKTVHVRDDYDKGYRMDLYDFIRRNWDFDAEAIAAYNAEEMLHQ